VARSHPGATAVVQEKRLAEPRLLISAGS